LRRLKMKKSSSAVAVAVLIIALTGAIFIGKVYNIKTDSGDSKDTASSNGQEEIPNDGDDIYFGEYTISVSENEEITVKYLESSGITRIYSIFPVETKDMYDILENGNSAVYRARDGHIWLIYNDGTINKLTPDKYGSIEKSAIEKQVPGYIWADKVRFEDDERVIFISNLPDTSNLPKESIWEVGIEDKKMRMLYTPVSREYKILGLREDGRILVLDGEFIAAVDMNENSIEMVNVSDKKVMSLSPDGSKVIYAKNNINMDESVYDNLYIMDGWGKNSSLLPKVKGYRATNMGAWSQDSSKYGLIIKGDYGKDKIGVLFFEEDHVDIADYSIEGNIVFPEDSTLQWTSGNSLLIDIGEDVVTVELE